MSEQPILDETERMQGHEALRKNTAAAVALAGAVRSTLGPKGLDKLLVDAEGRTLVTNDGITVLSTAKVEHPVARMIINASSTQERSVHDGTTSTVIICAEMLRNAWHLVSQGVHPAIVARGFSLAETQCLVYLEDLIVDGSIEQAVLTCMNGKLDKEMQQHISRLAIQAAEIILQEEKGRLRSDPTRVKVIQQSGGKMRDTILIEGLALAKSCIHPDMETSKTTGSVLLLDGGIEREKSVFDTTLKISSVGMLDAFRDVEVTSLMKKIDKIRSLKADLVVCRDGVDDEARQALMESDILVYRRVEKSDLDLLSMVTGSKVIDDIELASKADLGVFISTKEQTSGGINHWILEAEEGGATLIARGSTSDITDEIERCFSDALGVACQLLEESQLLPGAGAVYIALARRLRRFAESISGREQLAIEAWADALEVIPRVLAENAGMDPTDCILELTSAQSNFGDRIGLDLEGRTVIDAVENKIFDLYSVVRQALSVSNETAISVLRIDDILWAQQDPQVPDQIQQQLDAETGNA